MLSRLFTFFTAIIFITNFNSVLAQTEATSINDSFSGINKITIDSDFCAVKITGHDKKEVLVNGIIKSNENKSDYKINTSVSDKVLTINVSKPSQWTSHWGEIIVDIPDGLIVEVKSMSGKLELKSIKQGDFTFNSKSGHLAVDDFNGKLISVSPAGDITLNNFNGDVNAKSKSGLVTLINTKGNITVSSDKGDFFIDKLNGNLKAYGGEGSVDAKNSEGDLFFKSTNGDLKISLIKGKLTTRTFEGNQKIFQSEASYNIQASTGNITGNRIKFSSSSTFQTTEGNIKVQMDTKSDLAFILKSENSYLRAMGKSKKKSLKVGKGSIVITGNSTTGAQAFY